MIEARMVKKVRTMAIVPIFILVIDMAFYQIAAQSFKDQQRRYPRIRATMEAKAALLEGLFGSKGLPYPPSEIFIRIFKRERALAL